ncbi:MAG: hypothetical protein C4294_02160 [Nitrospiraceae bacterium]
MTPANDGPVAIVARAGSNQFRVCDDRGSSPLRLQGVNRGWPATDMIVEGLMTTRSNAYSCSPQSAGC